MHNADAVDGLSGVIVITARIACSKTGYPYTLSLHDKLSGSYILKTGKRSCLWRSVEISLPVTIQWARCLQQ